MMRVTTFWLFVILQQCSPALGCTDEPSDLNGSWSCSAGSCTLTCNTNHQPSSAHSTTVTCQNDGRYSYPRATCSHESITCRSLDQATLSINGNQQGNPSSSIGSFPDPEGVDTSITSYSLLEDDNGRYAILNRNALSLQQSCDPTTSPCSCIVLSVAVIHTPSSSTQTVCPLAIAINQQDTEKPRAICKSGVVTIAVANSYQVKVEDIDDGSNDNCAIRRYTVEGGSLSSGDIGNTKTVNLMVNDLSNNWERCSSEVSVVPVDCGSLSDSNGVWSGSTTFQSTATLSCNNGYSVVGAGTATCQADGLWTPTGSCVVDCGEVSQPVDNGSWEHITTIEGSTASLQCDGGYDGFGVMQITCQQDGLWSTGGKCVVWRSIVVSDSNTVCTKVYDGEGSTNAWIGDDNTIEFRAHGSSRHADVRQCTTTLTTPITAVRALFNIELLQNRVIGNGRALQSWGQPVDTTGWAGNIAFGTEQHIVYPGGDYYRDGQKTISEAEVPTSTELRFSMEQPDHRSDFRWSVQVDVVETEIASGKFTALGSSSTSNDNEPNSKTTTNRPANNPPVVAVLAVIGTVVCSLVVALLVKQLRQPSEALECEPEPTELQV